MQEQLISFETAKLAKEKGFNIKTLFAYNLLGVTNNSFKIHRKKDFDEFSNTFCFTPTQSLLQKWLREEHEIHIEISYGKDKTNVWFNPNIYSLIKPQDGDDLDCYNDSYAELVELNQYDSYEEALEAGLLEALKLI